MHSKTELLFPLVMRATERYDNLLLLLLFFILSQELKRNDGIWSNGIYFILLLSAWLILRAV